LTFSFSFFPLLFFNVFKISPQVGLTPNMGLSYIRMGPCQFRHGHMGFDGMTMAKHNDESANDQRTAALKEKLTLTVEEAAARLGVSRNSAYDAVKLGTIPAIRIGKRIVI